MRIVAKWHRHLPDIQGGLFAVSCWRDATLVGVGLAGHPSRMWMGQEKIVISRIALNEHRPTMPHINRHGEHHTSDSSASKLYSALLRASQALGWREAWTYTLPWEPGSSLRGAGFIDMGLTEGGEHDRQTRRRAPTRHPEPKRRWRKILGRR